MTEKRGIARGGALFLRFIQHLCAAGIVAALLVAVIGSDLKITSLSGDSYYNLFQYDSGNEFQDTVLVNSILGKDVADILRFGAIADQLETNGKYDAKKVIDVVGYNYRDADLPSQYTTAKYYLEDLLKWGKFGVNTSPFDNRYKTVDGKNIEDIVSTIEEYDSLVKHIEKASADLYSNYKEYLAYKSYYTTEKSNLRYCILKKDASFKAQNSIITNVDSLSDGKNTPELYFNGMMSYIQYVPSELVYKTNSSISEQTFRNLELQYSYAYSENTEIWIGIDNVYENGIGDEFGQAKSAYDHVYTILYPCVYIAIALAVIYVAILLYLTIKEGRSRKGGKSVLTQFDLIATEAFLVIFVIFVTLVGTGCALFSEFVIPADLNLLNNLYEFAFVLAIVGFIADVIWLFFYYSFIRRCKTGVIWRNSIIIRGIRKAVRYLNKVFLNAPIAGRIIIPFVLFTLVNLIAVKLGAGCLIGALLIDVLVAGYLFEEALKRQDIMKGIRQISEGDFTYRADTEKLHGENKMLGEAVNSIGDGIKVAVETSMKDERMKSDLITNVSHDIKTPLTSIISYVDLLKREKIEDEKITGYIQVLDEKSQRLKQLTDDLVEASKISSGNIVLQMEKINLVELINQSIAEFDEKLEEKGLQVVLNNSTSNPYVCADSRRIWRVIENLFTNVYKYSLEQTRVYVDLTNTADLQKVVLVMKNISADSLNCDPKELTERFIRGDESRTTEGSGLGLSIAKNLVEIQKGQFEVQLDGDLFKVQITFPVFTEDTKPGIITVEAEEM